MFTELVYIQDTIGGVGKFSREMCMALASIHSVVQYQ